MAATSPETSAHARDHLDALVERLGSDAVLNDALDVRVIPVAVSREQARVLIEETRASAVVFGSVRVAAGTARWQAEMLLRWPNAEFTGPAAHINLDPDDKTVVVEQFGRRERVPARHEKHVDPQHPLQALTAERFDARHADLIEGTLHVLVADFALASDRRAEAAPALAAAERHRDVLSLKTRAALEIARAHAARAGETKAVLRRLEQAGNADADHADLWNTALLLAYITQTPTKASANQRVRFARRAVQADPHDPTARYNLGSALAAARKGGAAQTELQRAAEHPSYRNRAYVHMDIGMLAYNSGDNALAASGYSRAVELDPTATGHLFLADAQRRLGHTSDARENYLHALRLDGRLVAAHQGYWHVQPEGGDESVQRFAYDRIAEPLMEWSGRSLWRRRLTRPLIWRLARRHHRAHPEDTRLYFSLGAYALIRGELEAAEDFLSFAVEVLPADLQARARLAVVYGLQRETAKATRQLDILKQAPIMPGAPGDPGFPFQLPDGIAARALDLWMPFLDEPRLANHPQYEAVSELFERKLGKDLERWAAEHPPNEGDTPEPGSGVQP